MIFAAKNGYQFEQIEFDVRERSGKSRFGSVFLGNYKIMRAILFSIMHLK
jgi:hypothetical protein